MKKYPNNSMDLIWSVDVNLKLINANDAYRQAMLNVTNRDILSGDSIVFPEFGKEKVKTWTAYYKKALSGSVFSIEESYYNPDIGEEIYGIITFNPFHNKEGQVIGLACFSRDISEQKKQEKELQNAKAELANIFDSSLDVICTIDEEGRFVKVSKAAREVLGHPAENLEGKFYIDFVYEADKGKTNQAARDIVSGVDMTNFDNRYVGANGEIVPITWSARWVETSKLMYCVARNATEKLKEVEAGRKIENKFKSLIQDGSDLVGVLDEEGVYTYVSPTSKSILGFLPEDFIGKSAFDFIHEEDKERVYSDFTRLKKENRITISPFRFRNIQGEWRWIETIATNLLSNVDVNGIVVNSRDITERKEEEQHLKLLQSVITNANDVIIITEAEPLDEPGPRIVYVNDAFTRLTGYTSEEVIGKTPRILQGPKSDLTALKKFGRDLRSWKPSEITTINYKKNGAEFWLNFTAIPVANKNGWYTHWFAIERDVTESKNTEAVKELTAKISMIFNNEIELHVALENLCFEISQFAQLSLCEIWLKNDAGNLLELICKYPNDSASVLFYEDNEIVSFEKGKGLPGLVWETKELIMEEVDKDHDGILLRNVYARKVGIKTFGGIPLIYKNESIGVLVFASKNNASTLKNLTNILTKLKTIIGSEIGRKRTEIELTNFLEFAPNAKIIMSYDGKIKRVNPAAIRALGYSQQEIIVRNFQDLIHPEDVIKLKQDFEKLQIHASGYTFQNRIITHSGKTKTFSWSTTFSNIDRLIYIVGKDISDQVKTDQLLKEATKLARIGSWEVDLFSNTLLWDDLTYEIHEIENTIELDLYSSINFYKEEYHKTIEDAFRKCIEEGITFDFEAILITAKKNEVWVRCIGSADFMNGKCVRIYGSIQDIHKRAIAILELEKNIKTLRDYKFSLDQSSIIAFTDKFGIITSVNDNFCAISKYSKEEVIGKTHRIINSKHHSKAFFEALWNTISTGNVWRGELKNRAKDGTYYWVYTTIVPFMDENNKPFQYLAIRYDITESKKAEQEKNRLLTTLENSLNEIYIFDAKTFHFSYVNKSALINLGYNSEEIKKLTPLDLKPEYNELTFNELVSPLILKKEEKIVFFTDHKRKNGSLYPVEVHLQLVTEENNSRFLAIIMDITERKKAESHILEANERFEKVTAATADAIWDWDIENNTLFRGSGFEKLMGVELGELPKNKFIWEDNYIADDPSLVRKSINKALLNKRKNNWEMQYRIKHHTGSIKIVLDKGVIIRDKNKKATRMVGAITDITYIKEHENELLELNTILKAKLTELETAYEELEQFTYIASHDLQEPLRMISSFIEQLKRKYGDQLDSKAHQYIEFSIDGARRMKQIILDLLEYSRAGKIQEESKHIDINDILNDFKVLRRKIIDEKDVVLNITSHSNIKGYKTPLIQVIHNLLDNAIKYSKPDINPVIDIAIEEFKSEWKISIQDNGIGIDQRYFEKIFIIFQRLHNRDEYEGTGIGLSIVKKHVESWGGKIWIDSQLNQGSKFHFTIPK